MDSSKKGRAIYLVASGLIVVGAAIAILQSIGQLSILTIESSMYLAPLIGLLSLSFLIRQPDRSVVEGEIIKYIYMIEDKVNEIKVQMASILLYISPWESSSVLASKIERMFLDEIDRTLRSKEMKEQIDNYKQAFWLVLLTPFSFLSIVIILPIYWWVLGVLGFSIGLSLAFLLLNEEGNTLTRIVDYSFARWAFETISFDLNRRKAGVRMDSEHKERLEASLELAKPVIELAVRGDWKGFDQNSGNLEHLVGLPGYDELNWNRVERYLIFLKSCTSNIHASHVDISLNNGKTQINSAVSILEECGEHTFNEEEESVKRMLLLLTDSTKDRETYLTIDEKFYEKLEKEALENLSDGSITILGGMLFWLNKIGVPGNRDIKGVDSLSWLLVNAAEREFLNLNRVLSLVAKWETEPTTIFKAFGPASIKLLLENDVGFSITQLSTIAKALGTRILNDDNTDPYQVLAHLEELKKNNPKEIVKQFALELQVDTKRSQNDTINTGMEAITRFIDDFYTTE